jgi:hypothetical protein
VRVAARRASRRGPIARGGTLPVRPLRGPSRRCDRHRARRRSHGG